jgi:hypothetical protein
MTSYDLPQHVLFTLFMSGLSRFKETAAKAHVAWIFLLLEPRQRLIGSTSLHGDGAARTHRSNTQQRLNSQPETRVNSKYRFSTRRYTETSFLFPRTYATARNLKRFVSHVWSSYFICKMYLAVLPQAVSRRLSTTINQVRCQVR